jgi:hypothetical protein
VSIRLVILFLLVAGWTVLPSEAQLNRQIDRLTIDGKNYQNVKFGPANQGKVLIYHLGGVSFVPIEKIPADYGYLIFGYDKEMAVVLERLKKEEEQQAREAEARAKAEAEAAAAERAANAGNPNPNRPRRKRPNPAQQDEVPQPQPLPTAEATVSPQQREWEAYEKDRASNLILGGALVPRSSLQQLTGFVVSPHVEITVDDKVYKGSSIEIATKITDSPAAGGAIDLRPGLWKGTGEVVILLDCVPAEEGGMLVRVYGKPSEPISGKSTFLVGAIPTFDEWKKLKSP